MSRVRLRADLQTRDSAAGTSLEGATIAHAQLRSTMHTELRDTALTHPSSRLGPGLLVVGAGILLYRTIALLVAGAGRVLKRWIVGLTFAEMLVDAITIARSARWWLTQDPRHARTALRVGAAATVLHAVRVAVFVLGRIGPWKDFDVRPDKRADHDERWNWPQVGFAGALAVMGLVGVFVTFRNRGRAARSPARHRLRRGQPA